MTSKREILQWCRDIEYPPGFFSWKECVVCKCFYSNDEDGILTEEREWICHKCNTLKRHKK